MRLYVAILTGVTLFRTAQAHNIMGYFIVNGTQSPEWKYIRDVQPYFINPGTLPGDQFMKTVPQEDLYNSNITCGRNAFDAAPSTETADVIAGSEVGFGVSATGDNRWNRFYHPGPGQAYLSRAPNDDVKNYVGDGEWFKIAYAGPKNNSGWEIWETPNWNFTIPRTTPPGQYLLRLEQFMPTASFNYSQWYVNCAQINIIGPGGGTPRGFARFPGTYEISDRGIRIPENQELLGGFVPNDQLRLMDYVPPGPPVWTG